MEKQMKPDKQNNTLNVAIYSRCSTKGKGQTTENQTLILQEYVHKMGYNLFSIYEDYETGTMSNRSQFKQMFVDAHKRKFDLILFWSLDRFSRSGTRETINLLQQLENWQVRYKSYSEPYLDSSGVFKDVIISLLATLARQESIRCSERVKAGLARANKKGRFGGRPRLEQEKVDAIIKLRQDGLSLRKIAKRVGVHHCTVAEYLIN